MEQHASKGEEPTDKVHNKTIKFWYGMLFRTFLFKTLEIRIYIHVKYLLFQKIIINLELFTSKLFIN